MNTEELIEKMEGVDYIDSGVGHVILLHLNIFYVVSNYNFKKGKLLGASFEYGSDAYALLIQLNLN